MKETIHVVPLAPGVPIRSGFLKRAITTKCKASRVKPRERFDSCGYPFMVTKVSRAPTAVKSQELKEHEVRVIVDVALTGMDAYRERP